jgi:hypothetical protein
MATVLAKKPCEDGFTVDIIGSWGSFVVAGFVMAYIIQLILAISFLC